MTFSFIFGNNIDVEQKKIKDMTLDNLFTLGMLIMLQAVLGIDNLLYISLASRDVEKDKQNFVRKLGIGLAIILRVGLLFLLVSLVEMFKDPFISFHDNGVFEGEFSLHGVIVFFGGGFILYTAVKEIWHLVNFHTVGEEKEHDDFKKSTTKVIILIVIMNVVFSFDSILSAMALTDVLWVMIVAIIIGGFLMIWISEKVSNFLEKNRMYEVLGLFILFLVGVMLLSEAGHLSHLQIFGNEIKEMNNATFYFIIAILVVIDVVQGRYQKKLVRAKEIEKNQKIES